MGVKENIPILSRILQSADGPCADPQALIGSSDLAVQSEALSVCGVLERKQWASVCVLKLYTRPAFCWAFFAMWFSACMS